MKKLIAIMLVLCMALSLAACAAPAAPAAQEAPEAEGTEEAAAPAEPEVELTATQKIIKEAEGMTLEELAKKAIEESNGATFYGVGNSSRGKSALPLFIEYLQTIDPNYTMEFDWQQPKNNKIRTATRSRARWYAPASWIPSYPLTGLPPTAPPPTNTMAICPSRP